jgi:putative flavoprotein involved in K+ transport
VSQLPPGGVLVIGSGQTGVQLAEELREAGREVYLSVGHCGRVPRRYRGQDVFRWLRHLATRGAEFDAALPTVDQLPDQRMRFAGNPHLSGHHGGHDTNLRFADDFFDMRFRTLIDTFVERAGIEAGPDNRAWPVFEPPEVTELDLAKVGISSVLWTTGYAPDYAWLELPILDDFGVPRHVRGISEVPGLTFIGLLWQRNLLSANLVGIDLDAEYLAATW